MPVRKLTSGLGPPYPASSSCESSDALVLAEVVEPVPSRAAVVELEFAFELLLDADADPERKLEDALDGRCPIPESSTLEFEMRFACGFELRFRFNSGGW